MKQRSTISWKQTSQVLPGLHQSLTRMDKWQGLELFIQAVITANRSRIPLSIYSWVHFPIILSWNSLPYLSSLQAVYKAGPGCSASSLLSSCWWQSSNGNSRRENEKKREWGSHPRKILHKRRLQKISMQRKNIDHIIYIVCKDRENISFIEVDKVIQEIYLLHANLLNETFSLSFF